MQTRPIEQCVYTGQFELAADPLAILIPRDEIIFEMVLRGEDETLDRVCIAVAVALDAVADACCDG